MIDPVWQERVDARDRPWLPVPGRTGWPLGIGWIGAGLALVVAAVCAAYLLIPFDTAGAADREAAFAAIQADRETALGWSRAALLTGAVWLVAFWLLDRARGPAVFQSPPGWPAPPAGWRPDSRWAPQPDWPAPPARWRWWRRRF